MKKAKLPTIIGIAILVVGLIAGIFLVQQNQVFRLGAQVSPAPKNVRISNTTDDSFSVSWTTDSPVSSFIKWGAGTNQLTNTELDEIGDGGTMHYVTVRGLDPQTKYYFVINSGSEDFDNSGTNWEVTTGNRLPTPLTSYVISGTILEKDGTPAKNAIVYATVGGAAYLSTVSSSSGSWIIPISTLRNSSLAQYATLDPNKDIVEISVQANTGVASAQTTIAVANPLPAMSIGETYDFLSLEPSESSNLPSAGLNIPAASQSSGFNLTGSETPESTSVTLDSVDAGETVTSTKPEFFGKAPPTTEITITVESTPQTGTTTSSAGGNWSWNPPKNLEAGTHTVTVSWRGVDGVLNTITRTFIVQAAEGPAFVATPSATPTNSPTSTATPTAAPSATPTPSAKPSQTPSPTPSAKSTATAAPIPESGTLTPTLILISMGIGLLLFGTVAGAIAYQKDERRRHH